MIINQLMALLLPSIVAIKVYEMIEGEENRGQKIIKKYMKALLVVNLISYAIVIFVIGTKDFTFTNQFTIKYMVLSIIVAIVYPIIEKFIRNNIEVEVGVEKQNEEEN